LKILEVEILSTLFVSGVYIYHIKFQFLTLYNQQTYSMQVMPVTKEAIDDNIEVADIVPLTRELFRWIQSLTFQKLVKLPNDEAGKA